jgi:hypothetical protein
VPVIAGIEDTATVPVIAGNAVIPAMLPVIDTLLPVTLALTFPPVIFALTLPLTIQGLVPCVTAGIDDTATVPLTGKDGLLISTAPSAPIVTEPGIDTGPVILTFPAMPVLIATSPDTGSRYNDSVISFRYHGFVFDDGINVSRFC